MVNQKLLKFFYYPDLIIIERKFGLKTTICMPNFYLLNLEYPKSKTIIGKKNVLSLKFQFSDNFFITLNNYMPNYRLLIIIQILTPNNVKHQVYIEKCHNKFLVVNKSLIIKFPSYHFSMMNNRVYLLKPKASSFFRLLLDQPSLLIGAQSNSPLLCLHAGIYLIHNNRTSQKKIFQN